DLAVRARHAARQPQEAARRSRFGSRAPRPRVAQWTTAARRRTVAAVTAMRLTFSSTLSASSRDELEALMYFNPLQQAAAPSVIDAVEAFGPPAIVEASGGLRVTLPRLEVQTPFRLADAAT